MVAFSKNVRASIMPSITTSLLLKADYNSNESKSVAVNNDNASNVSSIDVGGHINNRRRIYDLDCESSASDVGGN